MTDYDDLSTTELGKLITDEYAAILATERTNLQKALAVGEKLVALRQRVAPKHGDWQEKLEQYCLGISYETATKYIRLREKWEDIAKAAKAKGVVTTDLTIEAALKLIAKPKPDSGNKGKSSMGAVDEPGNEPKSSSVTLESILENTDADELFETLKDKYEEDQLRALAKLLVDHLTNVRVAA
jgi:hypothetical protein